MKNNNFFFGLVSALVCFLVFTNCNTTVKITADSATNSTIALHQQRLTIVYKSTDLTKDFVISFKNHLLRELQSKGIKAELAPETGNTPSDYVLVINVVNERGRNLSHLTGTVKQFRAATLDIEMKNREGTVLRKNQAIVNHVYNSELTAAARKAAQKLVEQLQITN